jgi:hypothetical protein
MACAPYQEKILRAISPGYIQNDYGTRELLEVSFCPVPAGRYSATILDDVDGSYDAGVGG